MEHIIEHQSLIVFMKLSLHRLYNAKWADNF